MNFYSYLLLLFYFVLGSAVAQSNLPACSFFREKHNCFGETNFPSGSKYVGEYKDNKLDGQGTYTFANGDKYVGEFKASIRNGKGTLTYANGDKYIGEFKNGKRSGNGTFFTAGGHIRNEGTWEDDKLIKPLTPPVSEPLYFPPVIVTQSVTALNQSDKSNTAIQQKVAITGISQVQEGIEYGYFPDDSCREKELLKCLSFAEYESLCKLTNGISKRLVTLGSFLLPIEDRTLLEGGNISEISVYWGKSRDGMERCFYTFTASGTYQGNSLRKDFRGVVAVFIKNKGTVLAYNKLY